MKYMGQFGAYIHGIPARDLTPDEWNELTEAQRKHAIASGLYVPLDGVPVSTPIEPTPFAQPVLRQAQETGG